MGITNSVLHKSAPSHHGLAGALFSKTQQRVLSLLFGHPERSYFANELIKLAESGSGAVQRELKRLTESGLVTTQVLGNQRHFQANQKSPIFYELKQIVIKTFGLAFPVREALAPFQKDIRCAFIFGSIAKNTDTVSSDIDLFIMSDTLTYPELVNQLVATEMLLGRTINATIYTIADAQERIQSGNAFFNRILEQSKIWLLGDESELPS